MSFCGICGLVVMPTRNELDGDGKYTYRLRRCVIAVVLHAGTLVLATPIAIYLLAEWSLSQRVGKKYLFIIDSLDYLPESLALEKATEILRLEGYEAAQWSPLNGSPSIAPNGTHDVYLRRNDDARRGYIVFVRKGENDVVVRAVYLQAEGSHLEGYLSTPK